MNNFHLHGRRALVTGSTEGIGLSIAKRLADAGADLTIHGIEPPSVGDELARSIAGDRPARYLRADCAAPAEVDALIATALPVDILVSTVAIQIPQSLGAVTDEVLDRQFAVNFKSAIRLVQACLPHMRDRRWGRIVMIGSVQEVRPHPDMLAYSALKSAQENVVRSIALQVASEGITVNNVAPGVIATARNAAALADRDYARRVTERIPSAAFGQPDDVSGAVLLLCSDAGRYITGATIPVDGGMHL